MTTVHMVAAIALLYATLYVISRVRLRRLPVVVASAPGEGDDDEGGQENEDERVNEDAPADEQNRQYEEQRQ